ncbi:hypothetical protein AB0939_13670 [Streptomyces sp. NPDC006990]|uniref:hypothetical protein n=1 Tax=Streptomyces sp. NPDC006990 TaxID=3154481 RepID=UPI0034512AE0
MTALHAAPVHPAGPAVSQPARQPLLIAGFRQKADKNGDVQLTAPGGRHHVDYMPNGPAHALRTVRCRAGDGPGPGQMPCSGP